MGRIGIYGGSFNPPHTGHVLAAREMLERLSLDRLLIIPAAQPPHKALAAGSPRPEERLELCRAAFGDLERTEILDLELRRQGPSYTVDTLRELQIRFPGDELLLIMGTDMLLYFEHWYQAPEIARLATLVVMHREADGPVWDRVLEESDRLRRTMEAKIMPVENRCIQVSSTTVRRMLALQTPWRLPEPCLELIRNRGWYRLGEDLRQLPFDTLREVSLSLHDEKRRPHVEGCSRTAMELALRWGAEPHTARRAGILHDITKALGPEEQLFLADRFGLQLSAFQRSNPKLLHAKTGAAAARFVFGESEEVYDAIYWHTTGRADMTLLEKILYIADYMEPNRDFPGVEALRDLVQKDLDAAILLGLEITLRHLKDNRRPIDPDSNAAWAYYHTRFERSKDQ